MYEKFRLRTPARMAEVVATLKQEATHGTPEGLDDLEKTCGISYDPGG